jgi:hypothetical protein
MVRVLVICFAFIAALSSCQSQTQSSSLSDEVIVDNLKLLIYGESVSDDEKALKILDSNWEDGMIAPLVEILRLSSDERLLNDINSLLRHKTGKKYNQFFGWMRWLWEEKIQNEPYYFAFKSELYKNIDPKFHNYFVGRAGEADIILEEVVWGGVEQDGIPPLRFPVLLDADEADYLDNSDIVFGTYINGIAKAYPKRILAWHEMFIDDFGDDTIAGVYCTLCGTVIAYNISHEGVTHQLGTSGFLYKSNKLMYDKATQSLWNTIEGKPVMGPLVGKGIELDVFPIVTTNWGEWKELHPQTKVLSLKTGHNRDYDEGAAYREYFATDELMFPVPIQNRSLKNKDEVLITRSEGFRNDPLAISVKYLKKKKWHQDKIDGTNIIVLADKSGAVRVYDRKSFTFDSFKKEKLIDSNGQLWTQTIEHLQGPNGEILEQLPAHNMFWFAWHNTYPEARLIK